MSQRRAQEEQERNIRVVGGKALATLKLISKIHYIRQRPLETELNGGFSLESPLLL